MKILTKLTNITSMPHSKGEITSMSHSKVNAEEVKCTQTLPLRGLFLLILIYVYSTTLVT